MSELKKPPKLRVAADPGKETATVTLFEEGGEVSATRKLSLQELDGFISTLGEARGTLVAGKPDPPIMEEEILEFINDVTWYSQPIIELQKSGLFFRHPYFGLIGVAIPYSQTAQLISILAAQLELYLSPVTVEPSPDAGSADA